MWNGDSARSVRPARTELDSWNGKTFISIVGFLFERTHVFGIPIPFHQGETRGYHRTATDFRRLVREHSAVVHHVVSEDEVSGFEPKRTIRQGLTITRRLLGKIRVKRWQELKSE